MPARSASSRAPSAAASAAASRAAPRAASRRRCSSTASRSSACACASSPARPGRVGVGGGRSSAYEPLRRVSCRRLRRRPTKRGARPLLRRPSCAQAPLPFLHRRRARSSRWWWLVRLRLLYWHRLRRWSRRGGGWLSGASMKVHTGTGEHQRCCLRHRVHCTFVAPSSAHVPSLIMTPIAAATAARHATHALLHFTFDLCTAYFLPLRTPLRTPVRGERGRSRPAATAAAAASASWRRPLR